MRDREWFVVGCRLFGVWVAYTGFTYITGFLDVQLGFIDESGRGSHPGGLLIHAFFHAIFAGYLLFCTRHLAWLCFDNGKSVQHDLNRSGESVNLVE